MDRGPQEWTGDRGPGTEGMDRLINMNDKNLNIDTVVVEPAI